MAWNTLREHGALRLETTVDARTPTQVIVAAVLVHPPTPQPSTFFLAFLPQFVSAGDSHRLLHMLELSAVFMVATFVVFVGYGLIASSVRRLVISRPRVLACMC